MKLAAPATAAVVTVLLTGLAGPAGPAAPSVSASSGAHLTAVRTGGASPGAPADGIAPVAAPARWKATRAPLPSGAATGSMTGLSGVACPSARKCVAVGQYNDSSGDYQGLLLTQHRRSWTAITAPVPAHAAANSGAAITAITCPSARRCVAVGYWIDSRGNSHLFLLTMRGSSWTAARAPLPAGARADLGAGISVLACPSPTACTAVGVYNDSWGNSHLFLLTMRGTSWTAATAPLPPGAPTSPYIYIEGIACASATACVVAGWYGDAKFPPGGNHGLLLTRHGSSWSATTAPLPAGITARYTSITGVACHPATPCIAGGSYADYAGHGRGLLLTRHRWSWTATRAPVPSDAATNPDGSITEIACPSATACTAIGSYTDSSGNSQGLLLTRHGS
jgi:hypothetical protein